MNLDPMQRQAREMYLEKRRSDIAERVCRCRAWQAQQEQTQSTSTTCEEETLVPTRSFDTTSRQAQRYSAKIALKMARFTTDQLRGVDSVVQNDIICKFLSHPLMAEIVPPFLSDLGAVHQNHEVIRNMKAGISTHLARSKKSHLMMAKDIICMLATFEHMTSSRFVAEVLGVDRRNIRKGVNRQVQLDLENQAFWRTNRRRERSNAISEATKSLVISW